MDQFKCVEFTGTWSRLFSRVKKHIIWGVLKSVTGMQVKQHNHVALVITLCMLLNMSNLCTAIFDEVWYWKYGYKLCKLVMHPFAIVPLFYVREPLLSALLLGQPKWIKHLHLDQPSDWLLKFTGLYRSSPLSYFPGKVYNCITHCIRCFLL